MEGIEWFKAIDSFGALGQVQLITSTQLEIVHGVIHCWSQHWRKRRARSYIQLSILRREECAGVSFHLLNFVLNFLPITVKEVLLVRFELSLSQSTCQVMMACVLVQSKQNASDYPLSHNAECPSWHDQSFAKPQGEWEVDHSNIMNVQVTFRNSCLPQNTKGSLLGSSLNGSEKCCWSKQVLTQRKKTRVSKEEINLRSGKITFQIPNYQCF